VSAPIVVIGSGASGVHFAQMALEKGQRVLMLDVGKRKPAAVRPQDDFATLKRSLDDPAAYFLGKKYEAVILPGHDGEYYGFPPNKTYIFERLDRFAHQASGFAPLLSFAQGGLAEAWTGGSYPFHDGDLEQFPFSYRDLGPYYTQVAEKIGISGAEDDLARSFPVHGGLQPPLDLDEHSTRLLAAYARNKAKLNERFRCWIGRSRVATLSRDLNGRKACDYSGRCLWACPSRSLYTPSVTLDECLQHPNFQYVGGVYVTHFRFDTGGRVTNVVAVKAETGEAQEIEVDRLVLAAGAMCSSSIFLRSIYEDSGERVQLRGLMDNRQVLMPFVNLGMIGRQYKPRSYQYHQVAIGVEGNRPQDYVHGLVTTLKTAPVVQTMPLALGTAVSFFRNLHAALGLVNVNFSDYRREENYVAWEPDGKGAGRLLIHYEPPAEENERIPATVAKFRSILWKLGCVAPPPMTHVRPMGASVHYAGMIPMTQETRPLTCTPGCRSNDFSNLYFADGITFPELPAKNLTFTLMANARRVADWMLG
jgi:choline dehydrogenase-like flavoprotein